MNGAFKIGKLVFNYKIYTLHCEKSIRLLNLKVEEVERKLLAAKTKARIKKLQSLRMSYLAEIKIYENLRNTLITERQELEEEIKGLIETYPKEFKIIFIEYIVQKKNLDLVCKEHDIPKSAASKIIDHIKSEFITF